MMALEFGRTTRERVDSPDLTQVDLDPEVEILVDSFPMENRERLISRIQGKPREEQLEILQKGLEKRKETLAPSPYRSPHLRTLEKDFTEGDLFNVATESIEVGRGDNGAVFEYKRQEDTNDVVVFKMLTRPTISSQNDIFSEGAYQADVSTFARKQQDVRVSVPALYYVAKFNKGYVLAMEKVPGYSIKDIRLKNIRLPDEYDFEALESQLEEFVHRMNDAGYYHRDLREGNIMVDPEPKDDDPLAYIIDFGVCIKTGIAGDVHQDVDINVDYANIKTAIEQLKIQQLRIRSEGV